MCIWRHILICGALLMALSGCFGGKMAQIETTTPSKQSNILTLSFVGDNVLGDYYGSNGETLNWYFENKIGKDYGYFFAKVKHILENDDMTLANLEGPLTTYSGDRLIKPFAFKGDPSYVKILKKGSVEAVNIANNHTRDYGIKGFEDTQTHLKNAQIFYSGEGILSIYEIKGKKIGMAGHRGWSVAVKKQVKEEIAALRQKGADIVIFTFHWGEEREHYPNATQKEIGRFAIDNGADIVIGHHPHVLQGIEEYKGKKIIYSLGNFVYGGAKNPADKDSIIYQVRFVFNTSPSQLDAMSKDLIFIENKKVRQIGKMPQWSELHSFIPVRISGATSYNNYQPVVAQGEDKERIIKRMNTYSASLSQ
ncbi:CapA family protein [Helicobacter sp. MIT 21-1697]|uniref:CapA family protein n=1 Tax=Helicobacter sp. MIT 21-1697 TaxID=2993733 RepID=UPI00224AFBC1|nr:CapA family protein [Helicobacter sp. MIT 21-1697]MCX2716871.1 CapA family protein [Helicobacter sp. MIT 21-1697]